MVLVKRKQTINQLENNLNFATTLLITNRCFLLRNRANFIETS